MTGVQTCALPIFVYPVLFRTQATKQYGPIREFRRRMRIALEKDGILPGDPFRTFRGFTDAAETTTPESGYSPQSLEEAHRPVATETRVDPTTVPAVMHDPFGSQ